MWDSTKIAQYHFYCWYWYCTYIFLLRVEELCQFWYCYVTIRSVSINIILGWPWKTLSKPSAKPPFAPVLSPISPASSPPAPVAYRLVTLWHHESFWNLKNCVSCRDNPDVVVGHIQDNRTGYHRWNKLIFKQQIFPLSSWWHESFRPYLIQHNCNLIKYLDNLRVWFNNNLSQ